MHDNEPEDVNVTPFQKLINNIDKVNFDCDEKYKEEYKRALLNVLARLDDYFVKNDLYKCRDYDNLIAQNILLENFYRQDKLTFSIMPDDEKTMFYRTKASYNWDENKISMNPVMMFKGIDTEATLCHEIFHFLSERKIYFTTKEGTTLEDPVTGKTYFAERGGKEVVTLKECEPLTFSTFLNEGLTELSAQVIYDKKDKSYDYETSIIQLINELIDDKNFMEVYLTGNLDYYVQYFGEEDFKKFKTACAEVLEHEYAYNLCKSINDNGFYIEVRDILFRVVLTNLTNNKDLSTRALCEKVGTIMAHKSFNKHSNEINNLMMTQANNKFGDNHEAINKFFELAYQTQILYQEKKAGFARAKSNDQKLIINKEYNDNRVFMTDLNIQDRIWLDVNVDKNKDIAFPDGTLHRYNRLDQKIVRVAITNSENQIVNSYIYNQELLKEQNILQIKDLGDANNPEIKTFYLNEVEEQRNAQIEENLRQLDQLEQMYGLQNKKDQSKANEEKESKQ